MLKYPMLLEQRIVFDAAPGADSSGEVVADPVRVLLVDSQIDNAQALAAAAQDGVLVLEFDSRNDTLADIESLIRDAVGDRSVDSIGFAGHGESGAFSLGSDGFVDLSSITDNPDLIAFFESIGGLLTADGRIDLLGCDIASGEMGAELIETLERLTGLDFAASDDATGNAAHGGDWLLETDDVDLIGDYFDAERVEDFDDTLMRVYDLSNDGSALITVGTPDDGGASVWTKNADGTYSLGGLISVAAALGANGIGNIMTIVFSVDASVSIDVTNDIINGASISPGNGYTYFFSVGDDGGVFGIYLNYTEILNPMNSGQTNIGGIAYSGILNTLALEIEIGVQNGSFRMIRDVEGLALADSLDFLLNRLKFTFDKVNNPGQFNIMYGAGHGVTLFALDRPIAPSEDSDQDTGHRGTTDSTGDDANDDQADDPADSALDSGGEYADSGEADADPVTAFDQDGDYYGDADPAADGGTEITDELSAMLNEVNEELFAFDGAEIADSMIDDVRQSVTLMNSSLRYLNREVMGLHSLLRYVDSVGSNSELLLWIRQVTDMSDSMTAKGIRALGQLTDFLREYRSLPVERRDMLSQVRIIEMNAELTQYNQQLMSMLAAVRAFSARVRIAREGGEAAPSPELLALIRETEQKSALVLKEQGERQDGLSREIRNAELAQPSSL